MPRRFTGLPALAGALATAMVLAACAPLQPGRPPPRPVAPAQPGASPASEISSTPAAAVRRGLGEVCLPAVLTPAPVARFARLPAFQPGAPAPGEPADTKVWTIGAAEIIAHPNGRCSVRSNAGGVDDLRRAVSEAVAARSEGFVAVPAPAAAGRERMAFCSDRTGRVFALAVTLPGAAGAAGPRFQATVLESVAQPGACARMAGPARP